MNSTQIKSLQKLKQSHTELHHIINNFEYNNVITTNSKHQIGRVIASLSSVLAEM